MTPSAARLRVFLREHFRLRVGEPGVDELGPKVREQVAASFPSAVDVDAIFHALLHSAWVWLRELGVAATCQIFLVIGCVHSPVTRGVPV